MINLNYNFRKPNIITINLTFQTLSRCACIHNKRKILFGHLLHSLSLAIDKEGK